MAVQVSVRQAASQNHGGEAQKAKEHVGGSYSVSALLKAMNFDGLALTSSAALGEQQNAASQHRETTAQSGRIEFRRRISPSMITAGIRIREANNAERNSNGQR
jgi:hypothetical protein